MQCRRCFHGIAVFQEQCLNILRQALHEGGTDGSDGRHSKWKELGGCPHCASDARMRVVRGSVEQLILEVRVWKDLGRRFDSPFDQPWAGHASPHRPYFDREKYPLGAANLRDVFEGNIPTLR